jgi:uncharacterized membrane protein
METEISTWGLAAAYWLHMLATVVWIGGLSTLSLLALPAAQRVLDAAMYVRFLEELQRRLDPLGWFCLLILGATGMFQMSANPNYAGFLSFSNRWAVAILIKHIVFFGMIGVSAYLTWGLLPELRRLAIRTAQGKDPSEGPALHSRSARILRLNLILSVIILALTAVARAA